MIKDEIKNIKVPLANQEEWRLNIREKIKRARFT